jgi:hypothetical protein
VGDRRAEITSLLMTVLEMAIARPLLQYWELNYH